MQFLAHRGKWLSHDEQNTQGALVNALKDGWGIETDIRDLNGELVISHDMPRTGTLSLTHFLDEYCLLHTQTMLALNIKSDGLTLLLKKLLNERGITQYFCFDMSVPDSLIYLRNDMPTAARLSEYEPENLLSDACSTLWVDGFHQLDLTPRQLSGWLDAGKQVCLVSSELHGRDPYPLWQQLVELPRETRLDPNLMLCTDHPAKASEFILCD